MITAEQAKQMVKAFVREACKILHMDVESIVLEYDVLPQPYASELAIASPKGILINAIELYKRAEAQSSTPLRICIYHHVRLILNLRNNHNKESLGCPLEVDAMAFAHALAYIKGLRLDYIKFFEQNGVYDRMFKILEDEFNLKCLLRSFSPQYGYGEQTKRLVLSADSMNKYIQDVLVKHSVRITDVGPTDKGTKENPFENIDDACEFVLQKEAEAYTKDTHLSQTLAKSNYFYDAVYQFFRIPWASPYVTIYENDFPSDAFIVNQIHREKELGVPYFNLKPNLYKHKFLYRGQSEYFDKCVPNLFRNKDKNYFLDDLIWSHEMILMIQSHPLVKLFEKGIELLHDTFKFSVNYGGLTQHYYNKSSFLDLTSNIEAAKFFATTRYDRDKDIYEPYIDTKNLGVLYYYEINYPEAFNRHHNRHLSTIGKQVFSRSGAQHGFLLSMEKGMNFNLFPEVHKVFFKHDPSISQRIFEESKCGNMYLPCDILEVAWKQKMETLKRHRKVSLETVKYNLSLNRKETLESLIGKLKKMDIEVDLSYIPTFSHDLLNEYYYSAIKGRDWWEEFCNDIYFYGEDGILYRDALMNLPQNREYRWAFYN